MELLNVGGNANNRLQCGLSYANSNNGFSDSRTNIGARLIIYTIERKGRLDSLIYNYTVPQKSEGYEIV